MSSGEANRSWSNVRWAVIAFLAVGLAVVYFVPFGGGDTTPKTEGEKLARLRERAEAFWEARIQSDWDKTYEFHFPPASDKEEDRMSRTGWKQGKGNIAYHRYKIDDIRLVEDDSAIVTVTYQWEMVNPMFRARLKERWLQEAEGVEHPWHFQHGDWYREVQSLADRIQGGSQKERARKLAEPPAPKLPKDQPVPEKDKPDKPK